MGLIDALHRESYLQIGGQTITVPRGVAQGSVLSPLLFNVYLDEALRSSERLTQLIKRGDLIAYADDLYIYAQDE